MKVIILSKKSIIAGALVACLSIILIVAIIRLVPTAVAATQGVKKLPIYSVDSSEKVASLTFDAAWGNVILGNHIIILYAGVL
jgi:hypothetical protein